MSNDNEEPTVSELRDQCIRTRNAVLAAQADYERAQKKLDSARTEYDAAREEYTDALKDAAAEFVR